MKRLVCELCGSIDLIKCDGVFVCQACGCKYSLEEAKKIMVEIAGSVEVTRGEGEKERLLKNAMTFFDLNKLDETEKIYVFITKEYPDDYRGWWGIFSVHIKKIEQEKSWYLNDIEKLLENAQTALKLFSGLKEEYYKIAEKLIRDISKREIIPVYGRRDSKDAISEEISFLPEEDPFRRYIQQGLKRAEEINDMIKTVVSGVKHEKYRMLYSAIFKNFEVIVGHYFDFSMFADVELVFGKIAICSSYCDGYESYASASLLLLLAGWDEFKQTIMSEAESMKGGCYIATAVYGSYNCPQVWTLRRFRDNTLAQTWYGRTFIRVYYAISPILVKKFGHTIWFRKLWKKKLDHVVGRLNAKGVDNTPYEDKI